jgi:hypothetical protein
VNATPGLASSYADRVTVDPKNKDVVYLTGQSIRRSADGGKTLSFFKGAPGGDDYHFLWISPAHPERMVTASDQGTVVTLNNGKTWSDWYNQPTGQFYHVETDDRFPYWVYSGQQDSGTAGAATRSDYGTLTFRDWHPVGGEERGWDVPDPEDPLIVYGSGLGGTITRFDTRTGEVRTVSPSVESNYGRRPVAGTYRWNWVFPIAISKKAPHTLYAGSQYLLASDDGEPGLDGRGGGRFGMRGRGDGHERAAVRRRDDLRDPDLAPRRPRDLDRHGQRPRAADAGRRRDLEERDATGTPGVGEGGVGRCLGPRAGNRLRRGRCPSPGRLLAAPLPHPRLRRDVEADRRRAAPGTLHDGPAGRYGA